MKIKLSRAMQFKIAEYCAQQIFQAVIVTRLRRTWGIWPSDSGQCPLPKSLGEIADIRATIRSIDNRWERRDFVATVKYVFQSIRREKNCTIKWQDYVAATKQAYATHCAAKTRRAELQEVAS
jgi:hypothetical protein